MLLSASVRKSPSMEKQGILTILCSDCEKSRSSSLRRTLSADMSSKKWLQQSGFFTKMPSQLSDQSSNDSSLDGEEECRKEKGGDDGVGKPSTLDVWGSILSKKNEDGIKISTPYVHPLVKRSASCLSGKSLEICTESLGSETGSDTISSYPSSEIDGDEEKDDFGHHQGQLVDKSNSFEDVRVVKYKNMPPRPLPPPIPSISADGNSIRFQSHRQNGRLLLEAVSVPQRSNFVVKRTNGRLVLSLPNSPISEKSRADTINKNKVEDKIGQDQVYREINYGCSDCGYEEEEEEEDEVVVEAAEEGVKQSRVSKGVEFVIMDHGTRPFPIVGAMKKLMRLGNKNPDKIVNLKEVDQELPITQSLPPWPSRVPRLIPSPPPATTAANSYHYFWRNKTATLITSQPTSLKNNACLNNGGIKTYENHQNMVVIKGNKDEYYVPSSRGCKKPRRSMIIWKTYCVAS